MCMYLEYYACSDSSPLFLIRSCTTCTTGTSSTDDSKVIPNIPAIQSFMYDDIFDRRKRYELSVYEEDDGWCERCRWKTTVCF